MSMRIIDRLSTFYVIYSIIILCITIHHACTSSQFCVMLLHALQLRLFFYIYIYLYIIIGASVSEPPLVDSTDALSRYIYIYI